MTYPLNEPARLTRVTFRRCLPFPTHTIHDVEVIVPLSRSYSKLTSAFYLKPIEFIKLQAPCILHFLYPALKRLTVDDKKTEISKCCLMCVRVPTRFNREMCETVWPSHINNTVNQFRTKWFLVQTSSLSRPTTLSEFRGPHLSGMGNGHHNGPYSLRSGILMELPLIQRQLLRYKTASVNRGDRSSAG